MRSVERGICPIAVLYLLRLTLVSQHFYSLRWSPNNNSEPQAVTIRVTRNIIGHVTIGLAIPTKNNALIQQLRLPITGVYNLPVC